MTEAEGVADPQVWQVLWQPLLTPFFCGEIAQVFADDTGLTFCVLYNSHIMGMKHLFLIRDISQEKPKLLFMFIVWFMGEGQIRRHPSLPRDSKQSKWRTRRDRCRVDCPLEMAEENQPADSMTAGAGPDRSVRCLTWRSFCAHPQHLPRGMDTLLVAADLQRLWQHKNFGYPTAINC